METVSAIDTSISATVAAAQTLEETGRLEALIRRISDRTH
jgi:hypothetical protein